MGAGTGTEVENGLREGDGTCGGTADEGIWEEDGMEVRRVTTVMGRLSSAII